MNRFLAALLIAFSSTSVFALDLPVVLQVKYSPWGGIDADEDQFETDENFSQYDMTFNNSYSGRALIGPVYISHQKSNADIKGDNNVEVKTFAIGLAGINYDALDSQYNAYLIGGIGIGRGTFRFNNSTETTEDMFEASAEIGIKPAEHLMLGAGVDFQHFGEFRESKASSWTFYISSGLTF
ncbi:hypothetical protein [Cellvibrio mixtus]|uniref:hypothetical protein n=1 Tax=Cellvibrio mixtus TaxID=39650 RepID=UPI000587F1C6|nr:hypothetical protein [Cellvibrio mixtus]